MKNARRKYHIYHNDFFPFCNLTFCIFKKYSYSVTGNDRHLNSKYSLFTAFGKEYKWTTDNNMISTNNI